MNINKIKFYLALSRFPLLRNSYFLKIATVITIGYFIPLLTFIYLVLTAQYNLNSVAVILVATAIGITFTLLLSYWLIHPIPLISDAIRHYLNENEKPRFPTDYNQDIVGQLMTDIQYTIEKLDSLKVSIQHVATIDTLTNIQNRLAGEQRLRQDMARVRREGNQMLIAMLDIDQLKNVNEQFGYHLGDICLKQVVGVLSRSIREGDWLARWNGDQFLMVLWNFNHANPMNVLERIQKQSVKTPLGELLQVSLAVSAHEYSGKLDLDIETDFEKLLTCLEKTMQQAKLAKEHGGIIVCK